VRRRREDIYAPISGRLELGSKDSPLRIPITRLLKSFFAVCSLGYFVFGMASAPTTPQSFAQIASNSTPQEERAQLEQELNSLEKEINQYESQVATLQKQGSSLKGEISRLNSLIGARTARIRALNIRITNLDREIEDTRFRIAATQSSIDSNKKAVANVLQGLYEQSNSSALESFLRNPKISDLYADFNNHVLLQNRLRNTITRISSLNEQLKGQEKELYLAQADAKEHREYQEYEKKKAASDAVEKDNLLKATKGSEAKYQQMLKDKRAKAAQIRARLFQLLGGGELSFGDAYKLAKSAGSATGVRPALILAVLDRESALGKNVGRCGYKESMRPSEQTIFLRIVGELNINPDSVKVSCAIPSDGAYGGAMGPAQFMPSTWEMYKDKIRSVTGSNPPSPWNHADAFTATALYMKDAGAAGATIAQERIAAAKYYAGGSWKRFLWTYGEAVVSRANRFQKDIADLEDTN